MSHTAKLTAAVAALILAATALAGCTAASQPAASAPSEKPAAAAPVAQASPSETRETAPKDLCPSPHPSILLMQDGKTDSNGGYNPDGGPITGALDGELVDLGPSAHAEGSVKLNAAGEIVSYTVAAGDVYEAVYKRFCFTDYYSVINYNKGLEPLRSRPASQTLQPGDVLILRPDPTVEWRPAAN